MKEVDKNVSIYLIQQVGVKKLDGDVVSGQRCPKQLPVCFYTVLIGKITS